jgi:hypothetical protein
MIIANSRSKKTILSFGIGSSNIYKVMIILLRFYVEGARFSAETSIFL